MPLPWLLQRGDPVPALILQARGGSTTLAASELLEAWTVIAIGPPEQVAAMLRQWPSEAEAKLIAIASAADLPKEERPPYLADFQGQSARRLGAWDGQRCLPVALLVEPRGTAEFACTGADLSHAVAQALAHHVRLTG